MNTFAETISRIAEDQRKVAYDEFCAGRTKASREAFTVMVENRVLGKRQPVWLSLSPVAYEDLPPKVQAKVDVAVIKLSKAVGLSDKGVGR